MKITLPVVSLALLAGLLVSLGCWTWTVSHTFSVPDPWWLLFYLRHTLDSPDLRPIAFWSALKGFAPALAALWLLNELDDTDRSVRLLRGARLVSGKDLARTTRNKSQQQVEIAGVPMPLACESSHLLLAGSTNSGKSTAVNELLSFALARGDRAIVIDPNGHALARFGKKGDTVLNPFDKRGKGWSIFNELRKPYDVERFAKSVIPDSGDASAQQWHGYAQQLFAETVRALTRNGEMTTERLLYWLTQASTEDLKGLLAGTAASGLFEPGADKALASTRFILSHHIGAFQYLQPGDFSLRTWLETGEGNLYITWREDMLTALRPLVSAWTDILIASILTLPDDQPRPLWLSLDELASLERLNSLEAGLTKGRKHGLRVVAGIQAVSQLSAIYGEHNAPTLRSCFRKAVRYIEVQPSDIVTANRLAHDVLGRTLDELPPQTRKLLTALHGWVKSETERLAMKPADFRFSRRHVRELTGWGDTQLKIHLARLAELEYILAHRVARGQGLEYELVYDGEGDAGGRFLMGLADMAQLEDKATLPYDVQRSGVSDKRSPPGRGVVGVQSATGRADEIAQTASIGAACAESDSDGVPKPRQAISPRGPSYRSASAPVMAAALTIDA